MRAVKSKPVTLQLMRRGKILSYALADSKDWGILFDNVVLEIKGLDGVTYYWPLDSITYWSVQ